jgi:fatty-acyl-CoA synthase
MMSSYNLADLFETIVDNFSDDEALFADRSYSYRELDGLANRIGHFFLQKGIGKGDHIGIFSYNRPEWLISMIAALKIRAVPININYRYTAAELLYMCTNADLKALVYEQQSSAMIGEILPKTPQLSTLLCLPGESSGSDSGSAQSKPQGAEGVVSTVTWKDAMQGATDARDFEERSSDDLYMLYTGGTTGYPKGVMWRAEDLFFAALQGGNPGGEPISSPEMLAQSAAKGMRVRSLICAPLMHGGGMWSALICFTSAGSVVLYQERNFDAAKVLHLAQEKSANSLMLIGDAMALPFVEELERGQYELPALFSLASGGVMLSRHIKDRLRAALPNTILLDSFGASETGSVGAVDDHGEKQSAGMRFKVNEEIAVLDDQCRPIKAGSKEVGYLARTGHIPLGYYKDKEKTDEALRKDVQGKSWMVLGDNARVLEDGTVELLGRASVCINSGGEKIFAEEVEAAIKSHPQIQDAIVVPVPHERFGQQVAALISSSTGNLSHEDLLGHLKDIIASFKCPKLIFEVKVPPRTPVGKPDYRAATELAKKLTANT